MGKPLAEAHGEVAYGASFDWFAEEGRRIYGDVINLYDRQRIQQQPVGVVAAVLRGT